MSLLFDMDSKCNDFSSFTFRKCSVNCFSMSDRTQKDWVGPKLLSQ